MKLDKVVVFIRFRLMLACFVDSEITNNLSCWGMYDMTASAGSSGAHVVECVGAVPALQEPLSQSHEKR